MARILSLFMLLGLVACSGSSLQITKSPGFDPRLQSQLLYVVPFDTVMVPAEVSADLFNQFVDRLNQDGGEHGYEFVILKQGLPQIDPAWLEDKDYLLGEIFAYVEDRGSSMTNIRARGRIRLHQPGQAEATLELIVPAETFYENDYSNLIEERRKLSAYISMTLADQLLTALSGG